MVELNILGGRPLALHLAQRGRPAWQGRRNTDMLRKVDHRRPRRTPPSAPRDGRDEVPPPDRATSSLATRAGGCFEMEPPEIAGLFAPPHYPSRRHAVPVPRTPGSQLLFRRRRTAALPVCYSCCSPAAAALRRCVARPAPSPGPGAVSPRTGVGLLQRARARRARGHARLRPSGSDPPLPSRRYPAPLLPARPPARAG